MAGNDWWQDKDHECFWLEATDRADLGADLRAPLADGAGKDNWRYTLFKRARVGDIVLHYDTHPERAGIVAFSTIAGPAFDHEIVWGARGTTARTKGEEPHARPGFRVPLSGFTRLQQPVTLANLRSQSAHLTEIVQALGPGANYFPFELSQKRELRPLQGYAFKMPSAAVELFPELAPAIAAAAVAGRGQLVETVDPASTMQGRNPKWLRDELIVALDLYMQHRASPPGKNSTDVAALSQLLNRMGTLLGRDATSTYRNNNGVYMKMMNFRRFDTLYTDEGRKGLTRGNQDEEVVWAQFSDAPALLSEVAAGIRAAVDSQQAAQPQPPEEESGLQEAPEGALLTRVHRYRERDRRLVKECKRQAMLQHGRLHCWACGFEFARTYGQSAGDIIECHHTRPVHTLQAGETTKVSDLALLCANCHRVVHSFRPWLSLEQLQKLVANQRGPMTRS